MWKGKRLSIENTILKKNKVRGLMLSNFHTFYEVIVGGWWKNRHIDKWNIVESSKIHLHKHSKMTSDKRAKASSMETELSFQKTGAETITYLYTKEEKKKKEKSTHRLHVSQKQTQNKS